MSNASRYERRDVYKREYNKRMYRKIDFHMRIAPYVYLREQIRVNMKTGHPIVSTSIELTGGMRLYTIKEAYVRKRKGIILIEENNEE